MAETEVKLSDEEKKISINFYKENSACGIPTIHITKTRCRDL